MIPFEADLCPETGAPRVRFNFANGWSASIVLLTADRSQTRFGTASVAVWPSGKHGKGLTELLNNEATADQVSQLLASVAARPCYSARSH